MATRSDQKFDAIELERVLVCGEEVINAQGQATIHYPSCRTLAKRFGTAHSTIAKFARDRDCYSRRDVVKAKLQARIEQKLTERRAEDHQPVARPEHGGRSRRGAPLHGALVLGEGEGEGLPAGQPGAEVGGDAGKQRVGH